MTLGGKSLVEWLRDCPKDKFPGHGAVDYYLRYHGIREYLNNNVHPHVQSLAMIHDGGYLTDHGPEHIKTVIFRASRLAESSAFQLSPYEVYVLLVAAHLHDVGNCLGRHEHELKAGPIMEKLGTLLGDDQGEQVVIRNIAAAHGGKGSNGDKDTIRKLAETDALLGEEIHPRILAALLRFSDELADDRSRAARFALATGQLPAKSQVYHRYANALQSVMVQVPGDAVSLHFEMTKEDACCKFGKGEGEVYLMDEIFERTLKMHQERMYCMRFLRPGISVDKIRVTIKVYGPGYSGDPEVIEYRIEESGYPESAGQTLHVICPELRNDARYGGQINGKSVHDHFSAGAST